MGLCGYIKNILESYGAIVKFRDEGLSFDDASKEARLLLSKGYVRPFTTIVGSGSILNGTYTGDVEIKHLVWTAKGSRFERQTRFLEYIIQPLHNFS